MMQIIKNTHKHQYKYIKNELYKKHNIPSIYFANINETRATLYLH